MAGGKGSRFWPLSRKVRAKQFLNIVGNNTLIEETIDRISGMASPADIFVIGNQEQSEYLDKLHHLIPSENLYKEPEGKNTLPCIGWAAIEQIKRDPEGVMVVLPADHWISTTQQFEETIRMGIDDVLLNDTLVTIGIPATSPHTGYGYIASEGNQNVKYVTSFHEKPDLETAKSFIKNGGYFWNSGMFIWRAKTILDLIKKYQPKNYEVLMALSGIGPDNPSEISKIFSDFEGVSIDYGVMEHETSRTRVVPATFTWSDIGSWSATYPFKDKNDEGNASSSPLVSVDSHNNLILSSKKIVALADISNLIVVETDDALLIMPKDSDQKVKDIYEKLPEAFK